MTRFVQPSGRIYIKWDPGDPVDWTTPSVMEDISGDEYCGNCGLDMPGCGCPRDPDYEEYGSGYAENPVPAAQLPVQKRDDPPLPIGPGEVL